MPHFLLDIHIRLANPNTTKMMCWERRYILFNNKAFYIGNKLVVRCWYVFSLVRSASGGFKNSARKL